MAEFVVNTVQLNNCATQIASLQRELDSVALRLAGMQLGSVLQMRASASLIARVGDCKWAAVHQSDNLGKLAQGLEEIAQLYETTEKNLSTPKTGAQNGSGGTGEVTDDHNLWEHIFGEFTWKDLVSWIGRKCVPFSIWSAINSFSNGDAKGVIGGLKNLLYAVGNGTKAIFNSDSTWPVKLRDFMGFKPNGIGGIGESWQKFLDDMNLGKQTTTAGKVGTLCKWAGYALTFVSEGIDNYKENGMSWRFVGETAIEGATYVGLSIGAGVLAAAALPVSAPAILVGAAAAGVVWLGDTVVEHFTGQDIGEWVSDLIYGDGKVAEVREWVGDRAQEIGESVREFGENVAEGIGNAADSFCIWVGGLFD